MAACIHCNGRGCTNCQKLDSAAHLRVMLDDARRERDEARAEAAKRHDAFNAQLAQRLSDLMLLQAENAALKAEVERLKLEGVTDRARAMLNDVTNERNGLHNEIAAIRAKLERAEAVVDAVLSGRAYKVDEALAAWRKPP